MKFKVIGQNRDTGARQVLEFEAESKGAAERKALQAGMTVNKVEDISNGEVEHTGVTPGGRRRSGGGGMIKKLVILAIVIAVAYFLWKSGIIRIPR
jgi:hypothetical protein